MLTLPLWIVTEHIQPTDPNHSGTRAGYGVGLHHSGKLFSFVIAHLGGEWKMQMVADGDGLVILIADLPRLQISSLVLDPEKNGGGGEQFALADLVAYADSLGSGGQ